MEQPLWIVRYLWKKELNLISPMLVEVFSLTSSRKFCLTFAPRLLVRGVRRLADTHGRVGVNDYNYPFFEGESINEIKELVPLVIKAISSAIVELIDLGGKTFLVPGNFPLGCFPAYLTLFETSEKEHDPFTGCIPWLNDFGEYHNEQLKTELTQLQKLYPHVC